MIHRERVREMTQMAIYEAGKGKEELAVCHYFRSDYVGLQLVKSFFTSTIAYLILVLFWIGIHIDEYLEDLTLDIMKVMGIRFLLFYGGFLAVFLIITFVYARRKYKKCLTNSKEYRRHLKHVLIAYDGESSGLDEEDM